MSTAICTPLPSPPGGAKTKTIDSLRANILAKYCKYFLIYNMDINNDSKQNHLMSYKMEHQTRKHKDAWEINCSYNIYIYIYICNKVSLAFSLMEEHQKV